MKNESDGINPYEVSGHHDLSATELREQHRDAGIPVAVLIMGYFGTAFSGAVFGLIGGPIGFVVGAILAGLFGVVPHSIVALSSFVYRDPSQACIASACAGATTGGFSLFCLSGFQVHAAILITTAIGAFGGFLGGLLGAYMSGEPERWDRLRKDNSM